MGHNDNPDGGYEHFHTSGKKSPHMGKLVEGIGDKRAKNSGTDWRSGAGKDPNTGIPGPQKGVMGSGGPGGIVGP